MWKHCARELKIINTDFHRYCIHIATPNKHPEEYKTHPRGGRVSVRESWLEYSPIAFLLCIFVCLCLKIGHSKLKQKNIYTETWENQQSTKKSIIVPNLFPGPCNTLFWQFVFVVSVFFFHGFLKSPSKRASVSVGFSLTTPFTPHLLDVPFSQLH